MHSVDPIQPPDAQAPPPRSTLDPRLDRFRTALRALFGRAGHVEWYCREVGAPALEPDAALDDFFQRAENFDVSPTPLFDPAWFRSQYRVDGVNAFISYLLDGRQRLARPSPYFQPRWYARQHGLSRSTAHPFLHYLCSDTEHNPHPLIDVQYLASQPGPWRPGAVVLDYLTDPSKYRVKPHPLFDAGWYLDTNPDLIAAACHPLWHYLYFGSLERRPPNKFFNVRWYWDTFPNVFKTRQAARVDPLTHYVDIGFARGFPSGPGLWTLGKVSTHLTPHGPKLYLDCLEQGRNLYGEIGHRLNIGSAEFVAYTPGSIRHYNHAFVPGNMVVLRKAKIALMYSAKAASGKILYWWLDQCDLLETSLRFTSWSHEFEEVLRTSREYIQDGLAYNPRRYLTYKFVRDPLLRAVSSFIHFLMFPAYFGIKGTDSRKSFSFLEFLDLVGSTNFLNRDGHVVPQLTDIETSGDIKPHVLRIEDGLDAHFAALERQHKLRPASFGRNSEISQLLREHAKQPHAKIIAGPDDQVLFGRIPKAQPLLTPAAVERIYALYRCDFDAYGYQPKI